jgi:hypothetical protein
MSRPKSAPVFADRQARQAAERLVPIVSYPNAPQSSFTCGCPLPSSQATFFMCGHLRAQKDPVTLQWQEWKEETL